MKTTRLIGTKCKCGDAFSWCVLIGRGLDHILSQVLHYQERVEIVLFSFEGATFKERANRPEKRD